MPDVDVEISRIHESKPSSKRTSPIVVPLIGHVVDEIVMEPDVIM